MMNLSSCSDEEFANLMETNQLYCGENYNGIFKTGNHFDFYDGIRYLIYLIRADWTEIKPYIAQTKGKYLDEIDIPKSDVEKENDESYI